MEPFKQWFHCFIYLHPAFRMRHYPILAYITTFSPLIPILFGILKPQPLSRQMKILVLFLITGFLTDILSWWMILDGRLVSWPAHIYTLIEFVLVISIIYLWQESKKVRRLFQGIISFYIVFWGYSKLTFEPLNGLDSITSSISRVILILCAGYTLFVVIGNNLQSLLNNQRFWVSLSFVLFFIGTLMSFALQGILYSHSREYLYLAWSINWVLAIFCNILFAIGFLCPQTQP